MSTALRKSASYHHSHQQSVLGVQRWGQDRALWKMSPNSKYLSFQPISLNHHQEALAGVVYAPFFAEKAICLFLVFIGWVACSDSPFAPKSVLTTSFLLLSKSLAFSESSALDVWNLPHPGFLSFGPSPQLRRLTFVELPSLFQHALQGDQLPLEPWTWQVCNRRWVEIFGLVGLYFFH